MDGGLLDFGKGDSRGSKTYSGMGFHIIGERNTLILALNDALFWDQARFDRAKLAKTTFILEASDKGKHYNFVGHQGKRHCLMSDKQMKSISGVGRRIAFSEANMRTKNSEC